MTAVSDDARTIVCPLCGVPYPAQYGGCPRCETRDRSARKVVAAVLVVVLVALYVIVRLSGLATIIASRF